MVDVRLYRDRAPTKIAWPGGGSVLIFPLSPTSINIANNGSWIYSIAKRLAAAIQPEVTADQLMDYLTLNQLVTLSSKQLKVQERASLDSSKLSEWIRKSVNDHVDVLEESIVAYESKSIGEFYNCPPRELTPVQVSWYLGLRSAVDEFVIGPIGSDGKCRPKKPSGPWLRKDREDRLRWLIDC